MLLQAWNSPDSNAFYWKTVTVKSKEMCISVLKIESAFKSNLLSIATLTCIKKIHPILKAKRKNCVALFIHRETNFG